MNKKIVFLLSSCLMSFSIASYAEQCPSVSSVVQDGQWVTPSEWSLLSKSGTPQKSEVALTAGIDQRSRVPAYGVSCFYYTASGGGVLRIAKYGDLFEPIGQPPSSYCNSKSIPVDGTWAKIENCGSTVPGAYTCRTKSPYVYAEKSCGFVSK